MSEPVADQLVPYLLEFQTEEAPHSGRLIDLHNTDRRMFALHYLTRDCVNKISEALKEQGLPEAALKSAALARIGQDSDQEEERLTLTLYIPTIGGFTVIAFDLPAQVEGQELPTILVATQGKKIEIKNQEVHSGLVQTYEALKILEKDQAGS